MEEKNKHENLYEDIDVMSLPPRSKRRNSSKDTKSDNVQNIRKHQIMIHILLVVFIVIAIGIPFYYYYLSN